VWQRFVSRYMVWDFMKRKISYISILGLDQNTFGKEINELITIPIFTSQNLLYQPKISSIFESPLKTPSSNLTTFYFKIGQLVEFDHKKDETKNIAQFLTNLNQGFKKQTASYIY